MAMHMSKMRVGRGRKNAVPQATERVFKPRDQVLVWREKQVEHRIGEWLGPFTVDFLEPERKLVYVRDAKIGAATP